MKRNWWILTVVVISSILLPQIGYGEQAQKPAEPPKVVSPMRGGTMYLSPQLKGNWVVLDYKSEIPKDYVPTGTVFIDLPQGITCVSAIEMKFEQKPLEGNRTRLSLNAVMPTNIYSPGIKIRGFIFMATTLEPGTTTTGKIWEEWKDGKSMATEFPINIIGIPVAKQPKEIMTGTAIWPYMIENWPNFYQDYASLGFNQMNIWHTLYADRTEPYEDLIKAVKSARQHGIFVSINTRDLWITSIIDKDPNAQALFLEGNRIGSCPSYRGPGFIDAIKNNAAVADSGISYHQSDEEDYALGSYTSACVCPRCKARWKEWLSVNRPELEYMDPEKIITDQNSLPELWRAWLWFRASLTTERYRLYKEELTKAVSKYGAKSSPEPRLGWWAGAVDYGTLLGAMQDGRALAETIDEIIPQLYFRYGISPRRFRELIQRQCWALADKNCYAGLDSEDPNSDKPGYLTAAVLETLFAGGKGYFVWSAPYMDTRQWAELATVNNVIAKHEQTFLKGRDTDLFRCFTPEDKETGFFPAWSQDVCTSTRETDTEGLLLITDYRKERKAIWIERSLAYSGPMTLYDAFTGEKVAKMTDGQWDFPIHLKNFPVKLLVWTKK